MVFALGVRSRLASLSASYEIIRWLFAYESLTNFG